MNLVVITSHDYLFFASQDYGAVARPGEVVGNYALMYAVNRTVKDIRHLASGVVPHYDEDLPKMQVYCTPATLTSDFPRSGTTSAEGWLRRSARIGDREAPATSNALSRITWNSTGESVLDKMAKDQLNLPKVGVYYRYPPLTSMYFYSIGGNVPSVFRLGKKHAAVRTQSFPLSTTCRQGDFRATCPVTIADLPEKTRILRGSLLTVSPRPVLLDAELDGAYIEGTDSNGTVHRVPEPSRHTYPEVFALGEG